MQEARLATHVVHHTWELFRLDFYDRFRPCIVFYYFSKVALFKREGYHLLNSRLHDRAGVFGDGFFYHRFAEFVRLS